MIIIAINLKATKYTLYTGIMYIAWGCNPEESELL